MILDPLPLQNHFPQVGWRHLTTDERCGCHSIDMHGWEEGHLLPSQGHLGGGGGGDLVERFVGSGVGGVGGGVGGGGGVAGDKKNGGGGPAGEGEFKGLPRKT